MDSGMHGCIDSPPPPDLLTRYLVCDLASRLLDIREQQDSGQWNAQNRGRNCGNVYTAQARPTQSPFISASFSFDCTMDAVFLKSSCPARVAAPIVDIFCGRWTAAWPAPGIDRFVSTLNVLFLVLLCRLPWSNNYRSGKFLSRVAKLLTQKLHMH
jgi:hypothetical protein